MGDTGRRVLYPGGVGCVGSAGAARHGNLSRDCHDPIEETKLMETAHRAAIVVEP